MNIDKDLLWDRDEGRLYYKHIELTQPSIRPNAIAQKVLIDLLILNGVGEWFLSPFEDGLRTDAQVKSMAGKMTATLNKNMDFCMKWHSKENGTFIKAELDGLAKELWEKSKE